MSRRFFPLILLVVLALVAASRLGRAQQPPRLPADSAPSAVSDAPPQSYDAPPAITVVDGSARLIRQGRSQTAPPNMPLIEGDRLATDSGRVEATFPDGSRLHVDRNTTIDFLSLSLLRLVDGRVILVAAGRGGERPAVDYQIDAQGGSTRIQTAGEYRVSVNTGEVELDVISGSAALATDQGSVQVEAGERSFARDGQAPADVQAFNSARMDAFDRWSEQQRGIDVASQSTQYLPSEVSAYASDFDRNGRWENDASYGYVWYPTVSVGWRPYYNGYWDDIGPYGWTWIGYDSWAWPTHHWGRWGLRAGLWFWIPGRHWGPSWVSWAYSPGYISWCPLDYYDRPLISLFFGYGHRGFYDPWLCWTVLPRHRFGYGFRVASWAVRGDRLSLSERNGFAIRRDGPDRAFAVARSGIAGRPGSAMATPRALGTVSTQARPRDSAFASSRGIPRDGTPRAGSLQTSTYASPRRDARSLPYGPSSRGFDRPGAVPRTGESRQPAYPGAAVHRGEARPLTPYQGQGSGRPGARPSEPGGNDRPSALPRGGTYSAPSSRGQQYSAPSRGQQYSAPRYNSAPRDSAPAARPRAYAPSESRSYGTPRAYSAPPSRGEAYTMPRYSAPAAPRYSQPSYSAPRYSAPDYPASRPAPSYSAPRNSEPSYSAPRSAPSYSAPRYSAPSYSAPRSAPSYSAPRSAPSGGGYAAPRSGDGGPRSAPAPSSRPAPSGSNRGGGRGRD